jgi:hypothetical protein
MAAPTHSPKLPLAPLDLLIHLLNFIAPALWLALALPLAARVFMKKTPAAPALPAQAAINLIVNITALTLGLLLWGRDGKMASYSAMVLLGASSQWLMLRSWRG